MFFGTLREHYVLLFGMASGFGLVFGFVGAWIGSRLGRSARERSQSYDAPELDALRQIPEIVSALDGLAVEVERLAESQRFIAKTLAERPAAAQLAQPPMPGRREIGQITPH
jgi:hypothetical protein